MKKFHRRASWLVAVLLGLSLMTAARAEAYGPFRWPEPGPPEMGDPDTPGSPMRVTWPEWILRLFGKRIGSGDRRLPATAKPGALPERPATQGPSRP